MDLLRIAIYGYVSQHYAGLVGLPVYPKLPSNIQNLYSHTSMGV